MYALLAIVFFTYALPRPRAIVHIFIRLSRQMNILYRPSCGVDNYGSRK